MARTEQRTQKADPVKKQSRHASKVEELACRRLSVESPYLFYFMKITCHYENGVLTLRGQLPTFYLKQVLQTRLCGLDEVECIDNQVDVVSASGLSSVRPK
jgi:hypothetical protein